MARSRSAYGKFLTIALVASLSAGSAFAQYGAQYGYPQQQPGYYGNGGEYQNVPPAVQRARTFGWQDGLNDGQRDRQTGHSFRPTHSDRYEDASDHGDHYGLSRGEFKNLYREAYLRGYERGYGRY